VAEARLIQSGLENDLEHTIDSFVRTYTERPFETILVLPDAAVRDEVKVSLVNRSVPVFGPSVCTLNELATYYFNSLNRTDVQADQYLTELILYKILEENQDQLTLFKGAWGTIHAVVPALRAFLEALKDFQVDYPRCLGDLQSKRSEQLGLIKKLYEGALSSNHLVDRGAMLGWATEEVAHNPNVHIGRIIFYGLYEPKPIEKAFIKALIARAEDAEYHIPYAIHSKAFADDGAWLGSALRVSPVTATSELAAIFSKHAKVHLDHVLKGVFRDPLDEARAVAREIRALIRAGAKPGSISIMLPVQSKLATLFAEVLDDHGIPASILVATPLSQSPVIMSIFSILDAVSSDYDRDAVARLLSSPYLSFNVEIEGKAAPLSRGDVDALSIEAEIIGGKESWSSALTSLSTEVEDELSNAEEAQLPALKHKLARIAIIQQGLSALFAMLSSLEGDQTVQERTDALRKVLVRFGFANNIDPNGETYERELRALSSFLSVLDAMEMGESIAPSGKMDLGEFVARLRMLVSAEGFRESAPNRNAVQVSGLRASYLMRYDYVFIVGMVDGEIPYLGVGNAFMREREVLKMGLLDRDDLLRHERFFFLSALLSSNIRTYVSRAESNGSDVLVPSYFFDELEAAFDIDTFGGQGIESSSLCCHRLIGEMIAKKRAASEVSLGSALQINEIYRRIEVEVDERAGDYHSPYDGVFADATIVDELDAQLSRREVYSASRLEAYAKCPFTFYLNNILGIGPRPEVENEMTPADRGIIFHRIACRFYSELRAQGNVRFDASMLDEMTYRIRRIGQEELDRFDFDGPSWQAFRTTMLGSTSRKGLLRAFLEKEASNTSSFVPKFFELSFGLPLDDNADPTSVEVPALIDIGGEKIKLRGRIDRVDALPDGRFVIIDYKTGSYVPGVSDIEKGVALQIPLYLQAVETMNNGMKGIGGAYYSVRREADLGHQGVFGDKTYEVDLKPYFGSRRFKDGFDEILRESNTFILEYFKGMRAGRFHPNDGTAQCPMNCEYSTICRADGSRMEGDDDAD